MLGRRADFTPGHGPKIPLKNMNSPLPAYVGGQARRALIGSARRAFWSLLKTAGATMNSNFTKTILATVIGGVLVFVITRQLAKPPAPTQTAGETYA